MAVGNYPTQPPNPADRDVSYLHYFIDCVNESDYWTLRAIYGNVAVNTLVKRRPSYMARVLNIDTNTVIQIGVNSNYAIVSSYPPQLIPTSEHGNWMMTLVKGTIPYPPNPAYPADGAYWWPQDNSFYDWNWDWMTVPGSPAFGSVPAGKEKLFIWVGMVRLVSAAVEEPPPAIPESPVNPSNPPSSPTVAPWQNMSNKRWMTGFEWSHEGGNGYFDPEGTQGGSGGLNGHICRDASRTADGFGYAYRGVVTTDVRPGYLMYMDSYRMGDGFLYGNYSDHPWPTNAWDRFYLRVRKLPTTKDSGFFWIRAGDVESFILRISPAGTLSVWCQKYQGNNLHLAVQGTTVLEVGKWNVIDIFTKFDNAFNTSVPPQNLGCYLSGSIFVNRKKDITITSQLINNSGGSSAHGYQATYLGYENGATDLEIDIDDMMQSDLPSGSLHQKDFVYGTHIQSVKPKAASSQINWTGNFATIGQTNPHFAGTPTITTNTPAAVFEYEPYLVLDSNKDDHAIGRMVNASQAGVIAVQVGAFCRADGNTGDYQTGPRPTVSIVTADKNISLKGQYPLTYMDANALCLLNVFDGPNARSLGELGAAKIRYAASTAANATYKEYLEQMACTALLLGSWGPEDEVKDAESGEEITGYSTYGGMHNGIFYENQLNEGFNVGLNICASTSGTYIGNGNNYQDIEIDVPLVHYLVIRPVTGPQNQPMIWWSSMLMPHLGAYPNNMKGHYIVDMIPQTNNKCILRICDGDAWNEGYYGDTQSINKNGIKYAYTAICDPGSYTVLNGAYKNSATATGVSRDVPLQYSGFTPELAFITPEALNGGGSEAQPPCHWRGPAHTGFDASRMAGNNYITANMLSFSEGKLTSGSYLNTASFAGWCAQIGYSVWRQNALKTVYIGTYTGNGTTQRDLSVDLGGKRPKFAIIGTASPTGQGCYIKDCEHTIGQCTDYDTGTLTGAIIDGDIDKITISNALNQNAQIYTVFAIAGNTDSKNGGWGNCGTDVLGPTTPPPTTPPGEPPPEEPVDPPPLVPGSGIYRMVKGRKMDSAWLVTGDTTVNIKIPNPFGITGHVGD